MEKKIFTSYEAINTFEDFVKSAIASCILIEKYQGYFLRNIFKAASTFRSSFNKNESRFLLCLSDNLHNVPELAELFIETLKRFEACESEDEISELIKKTKENFLLRLVIERLQKTVGIIRNKEERKSLEIKDNNYILSWCYELNALSSSCESFYTQLEEFIQMSNTNIISESDDSMQLFRCRFEKKLRLYKKVPYTAMRPITIR